MSRIGAVMKRVIVGFGLIATMPSAAAATPEETAATLSQVVINIRAAVAKNFTEPNKIWWLPNALYRYILARNAVLPAAIAGGGVHPTNPSGGVVLKMVVVEPRNEANRPDDVERSLLEQVLRTGLPAAASTAEFAYHARPIKAADWCGRCHGEPRGSPDPLFPKYKKEGWKTGEVIGAATARVRK